MKPEKVSALVCGYSMTMGVAFTEQQLNALIDLISEQTEKEMELLRKELAESEAREAILVEALTLIQDIDATNNPGPVPVSIWSIAEQAIFKANPNKKWGKI
jgi:hypothetical protein